MTAEQDNNIKVSENAEKQTNRKKSNIFISILKYIAKGIRAILIIFSSKIFILPLLK